MNETTFVEAKKLHDQIESINGFVERAKSEESKGLDIMCDGYVINISKKSQVFKTIIDFCDKALVQLNDKFGKL